jgi:hypothetical protein
VKNKGESALSTAATEPGRVLVLQRLWGGHRYVFVHHICEWALRQEYQVEVVLSEAGSQSPEFIAHLLALSRLPGMKVSLAPDDLGGFNRVLGHRLAMEDASVRVVIPEADQHLVRTARGFRRRCDLSLIVMRSSLQPGRLLRSWLGLAVKGRLLRVIAARRWKTRVFFLTDGFGVVRRRPLLGAADALADPAPPLPVFDHTESREAVGVQPAALLVGVLGDVSERKNVSLLLEALADEPSLYLLLAGRISQPVMQSLTRLSADDRVRVNVYDGVLSDSELGRLISACDLVGLLQGLDAPSGMLISAARAGTPVLIGESPWLRRVNKRLKLGVPANHSVESVLSALRACAANGRPRVRTVPPAQSPDDFAKALCAK